MTNEANEVVIQLPSNLFAGVRFELSLWEKGAVMVKFMAGLFAVAAAAGFSITAAPCAQAYPAPPGCESIPWGFLASQVRSICDGPQRGDGSWDRARVVWVPAHNVPLRTSCSSSGTYSVYTSCTTTGGYWVDDAIVATDQYVVFPYNVLGDEPGYIGTNPNPAGVIAASAVAPAA